MPFLDFVGVAGKKSLDRRKVNRAGKILHNRIEQRFNALVLER